VHYDIPWNPVKLDQRNGRAHRIGQQRSLVRAVYFLPERNRTRVLPIVASKNRTRRRILAPHPAFAEAESTLALPQRIPSDAAAVALLRALRARGLPSPPTLPRRHRAGVERLIEEMAREYLDEGRVRELEAVLERERGLIGA
jgi:hypothetical protein